MSIIIIIYCVCAVWLTVYGINCYVLTWLYRKHYPERKQKYARLLHHVYGGKPPAEGTDAVKNILPVVTTQLPIYNERNVAERLIEAVAAFKYPAGKHEIQVLDDSTDETRQIIALKVTQLQKLGIDIKHITRKNRHGFKAGALRHGLKICRGDFVAIFDADFVPPPGFPFTSYAPVFRQRTIRFCSGPLGALESRSEPDHQTSSHWYQRSFYD